MDTHIQQINILVIGLYLLGKHQYSRSQSINPMYSLKKSTDKNFISYVSLQISL